MLTPSFLEKLRLDLLQSSPFDDRFALIVDPLLDKLGWDAASRTTAPDSSILLVHEKPLAILASIKINLQHAAEAQIPWFIFTNGDQFEIYSTKADKPFLACEISNAECQGTTNLILRLLSKTSLSNRELDHLFEESQPKETPPPPTFPETDLETLCAEYKVLMEQIDELTDRKTAVSQQILSQLKEKTTQTPHFKISKYQRVTVKTSIESARALGCTVQVEDIDKEALRRLYDEGLPVPNIHQNEYIRISLLGK
ncbi:MAG: hypothetical protein JSS32_08905 [Verrucomicrobia bacterium]|nr:hypothetical protein [Verrucomicrobiota bacterium]